MVIKELVGGCQDNDFVVFVGDSKEDDQLSSSHAKEVRPEEKGTLLDDEDLLTKLLLVPVYVRTEDLRLKTSRLNKQGFNLPVAIDELHGGGQPAWVKDVSLVKN